MKFNYLCTQKIVHVPLEVHEAQIELGLMFQDSFHLSLMNLKFLGTFFFSFGSIKTVDDHCGYALPWDPLQLISSNNAAYHDIHHQTWGIKTNFSQPFFTFWDSLLGTMYKGSRTNRVANKAREQKTQ